MKTTGHECSSACDDKLLGQCRINYRVVLPAACLLGMVLLAAVATIPWAMPPNSHFSAWVVAPLVLLQIVAHEAAHAAAAYLAGAKPKMGFRFLIAYCSFTQRITWMGYLLAAAAPLVMLTVASVIGALWPPARIYALIVLIVNTAGSIGDVYIIASLLRQPHNTMIEDTKDGFRVYKRR